MVIESNRQLLAKLYPRLFHMSHAGSWPSIQKHGLLSTTALLDLFKVEGTQRIHLEEKRRTRSEEIKHPVHGKAMLRDQQPLNEKKLTKALQDGLSPRDWYKLLNGKVFFWGPETRLKILQGARLYEAHRQTIVDVHSCEPTQTSVGAADLIIDGGGTVAVIEVSDTIGAAFRKKVRDQTANLEEARRIVAGSFPGRVVRSFIAMNADGVAVPRDHWTNGSTAIWEIVA
jgi:hypothetical protein